VTYLRRALLQGLNTDAMACRACVTVGRFTHLCAVHAAAWERLGADPEQEPKPLRWA
jgi:hypothetical protein